MLRLGIHCRVEAILMSPFLLDLSALRVQVVELIALILSLFYQEQNTRKLSPLLN